MTKRSRSNPRDRQGCCWTEREDYALSVAWGNVSLATIAEKLHRAPEAVRRRALDLDLGAHRHNLKADVVAEICRAAKEGERVADIAERLGLSETTVRFRLKQAGVVPTPRQRWSTAPRRWRVDEVERLKEMMRDSVPLAEMAKRLGRTPGSVRGKYWWVIDHGGCWD